MTKQTPNFDPNWVRGNRFCDGYFQHCIVKADEIEIVYDRYAHAAHWNLTGYWTPEKKAELDAEYAAAIAKARGQ